MASIARNFLARSGFDANQILSPVIDRYRKPGLLRAEGNRIFLTERGVVVADSIIAEILNTLPQATNT